MKFKTEKNIILENKQGRKFLADFYIPEIDGKLPLVIFAHGYKGFKDWGAWNLMAEKFAKAGFLFVNFNFSMNGIGTENTSEFTDIEAFSENNYSQELEDLEVVIDYFSKFENVNQDKISLIGHSRGGGICILKAGEDSRISSLITMGSVDSMDRFVTGEKLEDWKATGVYETYNSRTKQQMPHKIQFLNDYLENKERFNIQKAAKNIKIPTLIIHGSQDESVDVSAAENLSKWIANSKLLLIENTGHTFNSKEPWKDFKLPVAMNLAVKSAIDFFDKK
ncbi:alpha/beta hydrolase family protein [Frigoriflavimonas asaccharolytica]|uniref:Dienelactone hydrolase n=1 Tax=Frigoriflavimonas asaccharolytica TaxID=2735899 RepID=A0A8J8K4H7_9FLAO|nr:alpha/beta fold hydrolase [Frigoriflavimonas asaccharolytica]NRS91755.1 dienelactone hydrolase [Frigoriflavimonas asaccharolytica]